jgi:hypothetical protein
VRDARVTRSRLNFAFNSAQQAPRIISLRMSSHPSPIVASPPAADSASQPAGHRYYSDRQNYRLLDEYVVAAGCNEREVMMQISSDVQGDFLFGNVFDTSDRTRQPVPCAPLEPLAPPPTACKLSPLPTTPHIPHNVPSSNLPAGGSSRHCPWLTVVL